MATARFLARQKPNGTAWVIGEGGLLHALHRNGYAIVDHDPDYVGGVQMGCRTVLVLSGGTRLDQIDQYAYRPDHVASSVAALSGSAARRDPSDDGAAAWATTEFSNAIV